MKNSLKNKLKDQYENHSEIPSGNLWERIELKLDNSEEKKAGVPMKINYWKYAAIFLMLVSLGLVFNYLLNQKPASSELVASKDVMLKQDETRTHAEGNQDNQTKEIFSPNEVVVKRKEIASSNLLKKDAHQVKVEKPLTEIDQHSLPKNKVVENQKEDSPKIAISNSESKPVLAQQQPIVKEKTKYITATELLFGREVDKSYKEQQGNDERKMGVNLKKPKEVKILGITVYSDEP